MFLGKKNLWVVFVFELWFWVGEVGIVFMKMICLYIWLGWVLWIRFCGRNMVVCFVMWRVFLRVRCWILMFLVWGSGV